jgi:hypothetical protein
MSNVFLSHFCNQLSTAVYIPTRHFPPLKFQNYVKSVAHDGAMPCKVCLKWDWLSFQHFWSHSASCPSETPWHLMAAAQCDIFMLELSRGASLMARNCIKIHQLCQFNFMSHQNFFSDMCNSRECTHSLTVCVCQTPLWTCFLSAGPALPEHCSAAAEVSPLYQPPPVDIPTLNKNITTYIQFWNLRN